MRRGTMLLTLLLAGALLAGCGSYCVSERAPADPVYDPVSGETIERRDGYAILRLTLPAGWDWADLAEDDRSGDCFGVRIWPEGAEGSLAVTYQDSFGVCGTDQTAARLTFPSGQEATAMYYGEDAVWTFLHYDDLPGEYVVYNDGADAWWSDHGEEAMDILAAAELDGVCLRPSEVVARAAELRGEAFDRDPWTAFDHATGVWTVSWQDEDGATESLTIGPDLPRQDTDTEGGT